MVTPNPDRLVTEPMLARRELQRHVREIVGTIAGSLRRSAPDRPLPVVQFIVAAGRPFRVAVEVIECGAAIGGLVPVVTIQEVTAHPTLPRWLRSQFGLTAREARVALLLARRRSNAEIARALHISANTARRHTANVLNKLNLRTRIAVRQTIRTAILAQRQQIAGPAARRASRPAGPVLVRSHARVAVPRLLRATTA